MDKKNMHVLHYRYILHKCKGKFTINLFLHACWKINHFNSQNAHYLNHACSPEEKLQAHV